MTSGSPNLRATANDGTPLIVDMDGALIRTDATFEAFAAGLFKRPFSTVAACGLLLKGRAHFKRRITEIAGLDVSAFPLREDFVAHLGEQRAEGRTLHLVSGSDHEIVQQVADRLALFETATGSSDGRNLKGSEKAKYLRERFDAGFVYAGDSSADLNVWPHARGAILAGASPSVARRCRDIHDVEAEFGDVRKPMRHWFKALRLHQWSKNVLIFAPLLLSGHFTDISDIVRCVLGFLLLSIAASGTYILNDLSDLAADRKHPTKRARPFASGALPIAQGLTVGPALIAFGLIGAIFLSPMFAVALGTYLVTTLAYSLRLKAVAMLDVVILGWLYTLRLIMGGLLLGTPFSPWLLTFAMFFFFSMSLAKRYVEIAAPGAKGAIAGRGYMAEDAPLALAFGVAGSVAATLILVLYLVDEAFPSIVYNSPGWLWATPALVTVWSMRIWLLAHRGELDADPVTFAVRDPISLSLGALLAVAFALAVFA
jgi:4-hydroxybenzoate polyprenyltransferase/phosphoserine phosphatase